MVETPRISGNTLIQKMGPVEKWVPCSKEFVKTNSKLNAKAFSQRICLGDLTTQFLVLYSGETEIASKIE